MRYDTTLSVIFLCHLLLIQLMMHWKCIHLTSFLCVRQQLEDNIGQTKTTETTSPFRSFWSIITHAYIYAIFFASSIFLLGLQFTLNISVYCLCVSKCDSFESHFKHHSWHCILRKNCTSIPCTWSFWHTMQIMLPVTLPCNWTLLSYWLELDRYTQLNFLQIQPLQCLAKDFIPIWCYER